MITAVIRNKENTLVLELPHSIYDIYEKLQSIGIMQPPKQIPLTDNEGEDIGVKLFSESDFGQHLLLTLNEKNTIADANMLNQAQGDREILAKQLNISQQQMTYVTHSDAGEGLIFYGNVILPFIDRFPQDTELYRVMTTKPGEVSA